MIMKSIQTMDLRLTVLPLVVILFLAACSGPRPVLYPNEYLNQVGQEQAKEDIAQCRQLAEEHTSSNNAGKKVATNTAIGAGVGAASGAVIGAVSGSAGRGTAIGAVSGATGAFFHSLFNSPKPSRAYRNFVDRCLGEEGYESMGWD